MSALPTIHPEPAVDPLDRCKQIRDRVADLEAEIARLTTEHNRLLGTGVVDADDIAWATGKPSVAAGGLSWRDRLLELASDYASSAIDRATEGSPKADMTKAWDALVAHVDA